MKIRSDGAELFRVDRGTGRMRDRHDEANYLYSYICNLLMEFSVFDLKL